MRYEELVKKREGNFDSYNKSAADLMTGRIWTLAAMLIAGGVFTALYFIGK